ncbi:MAG TPA: glycosyltransferase family 4 protein [Terriglobales bacterium]|jgi:colanic acid/amylovoran biosynthesis glycosyltransferase|nr:glycosyltransferase family 4 protein [Terriglobales bacterium]
MTTVAYIANQFPCSIEPYVMDEIRELRKRQVRVICCSGKRVSAQGLARNESEFLDEALSFHPLSDTQLVQAVRRLGARNYFDLMLPVLREMRSSPGRHLRSFGHTLLGGALAEDLAPLGVEHIHAHHGYFASWMALVAARLLGIDFSITLHGSDLLVRADLLAAKLSACKFCFTVSNYNREYILRNYPTVAPSKIVVQRLGVDPVPPASLDLPQPEPRRRFCLLSVGRLHTVKNYAFLLRACATLRDGGMDFLCWIVGEGPERPALERQISELQLGDQVLLPGHVARSELSSYYRYSDLVVMTSLSEGVPVVLMEAMAHEKLVIAPDITGIPELVQDRRTGFLYQPGSLSDFVSTVRWIFDHRDSLGEIQRAAAQCVALHYDRQRNLRQFADQFLERVAHPESSYANSLLQQVQLPV